jgi:ABC-type branched-subunit amino acid transport system substrate-binding protein
VRASAEPVLLGVLDDTPQGVNLELLERAIEWACGRAAASGRFARGVKLRVARAEGLPRGSARAVETAFAELEAAGVVGVLGPAIGDNALVATPCADAAGLPAINWAGSEEARSDFMFQLQVGSHEEEGLLLARHLAAAGGSVALLYERSVIGARYAQFFEDACLASEIPIDTRVGLVENGDVDAAVAAALRGDPETLVHLGLGLALPELAGALERSGFKGRRVCNSCGIFGWAGPEFAQALEGWTYVDVVHEDNPQLQLVSRALGIDFSVGPIAVAYADLAVLVVEGLARAPELTRRGLRAGLERVKAFPAALGEAGTTMGFGHYERGAYKGPYLVLRRWDGGRSLPA